MKYWYLDLIIRQGEIEVHDKTVHEGDFDANDYAQNWFGDGGQADGRGGFDFGCGEINIAVYDFKEINKKSYDVLRLFL
jgi:hypothetical protein